MADTPVRQDDDLKKQGRGMIDSITDQFRKSSNATADLIGGTAEAVGQGFRSYNDSISSDNLTKLGVNNGLIEGMVAGYVGFFEKMADTARRVLTDLRTESKAQAAPEMDVKALAAAIANALKNDPSFVNELASKITKKTP